MPQRSIRNRFWCILAGLAVLLLPSLVEAHGHAGFAHGHAGFGSGFHSGFGSGFGFRGGAFGGSGFFFGWPFGFNPYYYPGYPYGGYGYPYSRLNASPIYNNTYAPAFYQQSNPTPSSTQSRMRIQDFYPPQKSENSPSKASSEAAVAHIDVRVPDAAEVWFNGVKTTQKGGFRQFISPKLTPGKQYTYELEARWEDHGRMIVQTRPVIVGAGDRMTVEFIQSPAPEDLPQPKPSKVPQQHSETSHP